MFLKVCGLRSPADAQTVNPFLPGYGGLVFAPGRRQVDQKGAGEILQALDPRILPVGVFLNAPEEEMKNLRDTLGLKILQLHGQESPELIRRLGGRIWKALPGDSPAGEIFRYLEVAEMVVLDAMAPGVPGGSGRTFDWSRIPREIPRERLILAGGLNPENLREAMETVGPAGLDVASGSERSGRKDPEKIRALMEETRKWNTRMDITDSLEEPFFRNP